MSGKIVPRIRALEDERERVFFRFESGPTQFPTRLRRESRHGVDIGRRYWEEHSNGAIRDERTAVARSNYSH
ncbi:hypothetical protein LC1Hm_1412 [Halomicrobium sp. LC1Hm]|nr:hypothetical protein LC1Hm_1412 [Halomicrobium sp. LC1Hm]